MTRCPRLGGYATTGGRHAGAGASLPGGARCSRKVLHLPIPVNGAYRTGVGERQRPGGTLFCQNQDLQDEGISRMVARLRGNDG